MVTHAVWTPLHEAIAQGHVDLVPSILAHTGGLDAADATGSTVVHLCCARKMWVALSTLLHHGADPNARDKGGHSPLHVACAQSAARCCRSLLASGARLDATDDAGITAAQTAVMSGSTACVLELLKANPDLASSTPPGTWTLFHEAAASRQAGILKLVMESTPATAINPTGPGAITSLHMAAFVGALTCSRYLLGKRLYPSVQDAWGATPLHWSCFAGHVAVTKFFLRRTSSIDARDVLGRTPLHVAAMYGRTGCVVALVHRGADPTVACGRLSRTALHYAAQYGRTETLEFLLAKSLRLKPGCRDSSGATPLLLACRHRHAACAARLLERGAAPHAADSAGLTPYLAACRADAPELVELLLGRGGGGDRLRHPKARAGLHEAARSDAVACVALFLRHGADCNAADAEGATPLMLAAKHGAAAAFAAILRSEHSAADAATANPTTGETVAHVAAKYERAELLELLASHHTAEARSPIDPLSIPDAHGYLPLHYAALLGHVGCLKVLMDHPVAPPGTHAPSPYHCAARYGRVAALELLAARQGDLPGPPTDTRGQAPLHWAAHYGHAAAVAVLLRVRGAAVDAADAGGRTALHKACGAGHSRTISALLAAGADARAAAASSGWRPVHFSAASGTLPALLDAGSIQTSDLTEAVGSTGDTPLHIAAAAGNVGSVELLVGLGVEVDLVNGAGVTPLEKAVLHGCDEVVFALGPAASKTKGWPLHRAAERGSGALVAWLLRHGWDEDAVDDDGASPAHAAARSGNQNTLQAFSPRLLSACDGGGRTPLLVAAREGRLGVLEQFFNDAHCGEADAQGMSFTHHAAHAGRLDVLKYLVSTLGLPFNEPSPVTNMTPFLYACAGGSLAVVQYLLRKFDPLRDFVPTRDIDGNTALHLAASRGRPRVVVALLKAGWCLRAVNTHGWTPAHALQQARSAGGGAAAAAHDAVCGVLLDCAAENEELRPFVAALAGPPAPEALPSPSLDRGKQKQPGTPAPAPLPAAGLNLLGSEAGGRQDIVLEWFAVWAGAWNTWPASLAGIRSRSCELILRYYCKWRAHAAGRSGPKAVEMAMEVVIMNRVDLASAWLSQVTNIDAAGPEGLTPLQAACYFRRPRFVRWLLQRGADPNEPATNPPLLICVALGAVGCLRELCVGAGDAVDLLAPNRFGLAPLLAAVAYRQYEVADTLLDVRRNLMSDGVLQHALRLRDLKDDEELSNTLLLLQQDSAAMASSAEPENGLDGLHAAVASQAPTAINDRLKALSGPALREALFRQTSFGRTPLHSAAKGSPIVATHILRAAQRGGFVKELLSHGDKDGNTAFHAAVLLGAEAVLYELITCLKGPEQQECLLLRNREHRTALHVAAETGAVSVLSALLKAPCAAALKNAATRSGQLPIHLACLSGHVAAVEILQGYRVKDRGPMACPPLVYAAYAGRAHVVRYLLTKGAVDVSHQCKDGSTALHAACETKATDVVEELLCSGVPTANATWLRKETALHVCARFGSAEAAELLVAFNRSLVNLPDVWGNTALHIGSLNAETPIVKLLLSTGIADVDARNTHGNTPLHLACTQSSIEVVRLLIAKGANHAAPGLFGWTPIQVSCAAEDISNVPISALQVEVRRKPRNWAETAAEKQNQPPLVAYDASNAGYTTCVRTDDEDGETLLLMNFGFPTVVRWYVVNVPGAITRVQVRQGSRWVTVDDELSATVQPTDSPRYFFNPVTTELAKGGSPVDEACCLAAVSLCRADSLTQLFHLGAAPSCIDERGNTLPHYAARAGDAALLQTVLSYTRFGLDRLNDQGRTPLHEAVLASIDCVRVLLKQPMLLLDLHDSSNGETALHVAISANLRSTVDVLLDHGADPLLCTARYGSALHCALATASAGHIFRHLVRTSSCPYDHPLNEDGETVMHHACSDAKYRAHLLFLLEHGASGLEPVTKGGYSPLHTACSVGNVPAVDIIVKWHAPKNVWVEGQAVATPFVAAMLHRKTELMRSVLASGSEDVKLALAVRDSAGQAPIDVAVAEGYCPEFVILFEAGAPIEVGLLHLAAKAPHSLEILYALLTLCTKTPRTWFQKRYALAVDRAAPAVAANAGKLHIDGVQDNGWTPLHVACRYDNVGAAEMLLLFGAAPDVQAAGVGGPLHLAVSCGAELCLRQLILSGADPLSTDESGNTPRDLARALDFSHLALLLSSLVRRSSPPQASFRGQST
ncbi:Ankyrin repeat [Diplonema papillatum]|nr:Ankyrin repeat [Diplonema papillatum]